MQDIKISELWNRENSPLLVMAIQGGTLIKGKHECVYTVIPLLPSRVKFLRKLAKLSDTLSKEGNCGQPARIEIRDWSLIWDQEQALKIDATYWTVEGNALRAVCYGRQGKRLGQTIEIDIRQFKFFADVPVIWYDDEVSNSVVKAKFGRTFAKESLTRLKKLGLHFPKSLKTKSDSEIRTMLMELDVL